MIKYEIKYEKTRPNKRESLKRVANNSINTRRITLDSVRNLLVFFGRK
jgi:hypothetical protein